MAAIAKGEQRRALMIAGVGFVLVLALFVGSRVLSGGGEGGDEVADPPGFPPAQPETTPGTPAPGGGETSVPVIPIPVVPDALELAELRDPFTPPLSAIDFLRDVQPAPGQPAPGPGGGGAVGPNDVTLRAVGTDPDSGDPLATIDVSGEIFEANPGERFGPNGEFMVVSLDVATECGSFLFGDEPFSLCVGQAAPTPGAAPVPQK